MTIRDWGDLLPLIVFLVSASLTFSMRVKGWTVEESAIPMESPPRALTEERVPFLTRYRWEIILTAVIALILLFAILAAPPRLTGEIPPDPNQPGRPFYSLHWGRNFLREYFDSLANWSNILASLVCLAPIALAVKRRSRLHAEIALLFSSLGLAMREQWNLADKEPTGIGTALYLAALLGFAYWAWLARSRLARDLSASIETNLAPASVKPAWELPLVFVLLALTAFGRFYALSAVPYGIEGDEAKWTSEAVNLGILGEPDNSGEYHRDALPVSFYIQTPFHRIFGAGLISARAAVAFLSVLASLVFYWLLRQLAPIPLSALATFLLSVSIFDISASRLANVESFVKLGAVLPLALLAFALKNRPWQAFALSGLALALAALTYDTLWPIGGICLVLALLELRKVPAPEKAKSLAALFAPVLLTLPMIIPYFISRVNYYELGKKGWDSGLFIKFGEHFVSVVQSWFVALRPDFLYNREGPLLNAALLPWLALGLTAASLLVRERAARWLLVWAGLVILPVPILTNSPLGRVYYPALPAVYGLIALGLFLFWKEVWRILAPALRPILAAIALVPLFWFPLFNYFIYFNEVSEAYDRQMRREIGEIAASVADEDTLLVLAAVPNSDEPLNNEFQMIELFLLKNLAGDQIKNAYRHIALEEVIPAVLNERMEWKKFIVVLDRNPLDSIEKRLALTEGLAACFPRGELVEGRYFDQFIIEEAARNEIDCLPVELSLHVERSPQLSWELSAGNATSMTLLCDRQISNYDWLEAEEIPLAPGWQVGIDFAPGWMGGGFLMDYYGSQPVTYDFESASSGQDIYVWARIFKRVTDFSPAYLTVNGVTAQFADTAEELLNKWIWEQIGPFPNRDFIRITIARPYEEDPRNFMSLFMDVFLFTSNAALSPENPLTQSLPPQRFPVAAGASAGTITPDLPPGQYTCSAQVASPQNLVGPFGNRPVTSNEVELNIP